MSFIKSYEVCKDLEVCAVWDINHVEDRLMGDDVWHRDMKKCDFIDDENQTSNTEE